MDLKILFIIKDAYYLYENEKLLFYSKELKYKFLCMSVGNFYAFECATSWNKFIYFKAPLVYIIDGDKQYTF